MAAVLLCLSLKTQRKQGNPWKFVCFSIRISCVKKKKKTNNLQNLCLYRPTEGEYNFSLLYGFIMMQDNCKSPILDYLIIITTSKAALQKSKLCETCTFLEEEK